MSIYHAYEIATDTSIHMACHIDDAELKRRFDADMAVLKDEIDAPYRLGTVEASNPDEAFNKMRAGRWDYTEVL